MSRADDDEWTVGADMTLADARKLAREYPHATWDQLVQIHRCRKERAKAEALRRLTAERGSDG